MILVLINAIGEIHSSWPSIDDVSREAVKLSDISWNEKVIRMKMRSLEIWPDETHRSCGIDLGFERRNGVELRRATDSITSDLPNPTRNEMRDVATGKRKAVRVVCIAKSVDVIAQI